MVLVPELDVTDLDASLGFYTDVLGFDVVFQRRAERFTYLERDGMELMVEGPTEAGNRQFVVADPDGYLWRPFRDLGVRSAG
ncbi:MAG: VOC family protein [Microthrixaceae bacterium]